MEFTKLTIIPEDKMVAIDGVSYSELKMTGIPKNLHALQWFGKGGEIEYIADDYGETKPNTRIDTLPKWTEKNIKVWEAANKNAIEKAKEEEEEEAVAMQLASSEDLSAEFFPISRPIPNEE
jgi:hypothetical protein